MFQKLTLGERLSSLRQSKKMTQKDLAGLLNVSDKTISKWETAENEPGLNDIQKLSEVFDVSLDLIMKGESTTQKDNIALKLCQEMKAYNEANQEITNFYKKECPYKDINIEDIFIIINNKPYAIFDSIILLDDFDFYNKVNEKFTFVKLVEKQKNSIVIVSAIDEANKQNKDDIKYLPHPYKLTLSDLKNNNSIEFFELVVNDLEEQYKKEAERVQEQRKRGYGMGLQNPITVEEKLSNYLEHMEIYDIEDDKVYEKIIFLIEHGAVFYNRIPYNSDSGGYQTIIDTARTDFTYKVCVDHIRILNKLAELEEKLEKK